MKKYLDMIHNRVIVIDCKSYLWVVCTVAMVVMKFKNKKIIGLGKIIKVDESIF